MDMTNRQASASEGKVPWVGTQTLTWFFQWCRDHGIAGDNDKFKAGIIAGVFAPAAIAVPDRFLDGHYQFFIFPARLERWAEENAIDWR